MRRGRHHASAGRLRGAAHPLLLAAVIVMATTGAAMAADQPSVAPVPEASLVAGISAAPVDLDGDSDGDGLIDAAEDLDADGLSGLAELRFGTDPLSADSDADGTPDGAEDSDGDGITDAAQQDRRRLPAGLSPTLEMAWWDRPSNYDDRCHNDAVDAELHVCSVGDTSSDVQVVLFGDSHALQWLPALAVAAEQQGWQVTTLTKAACPPAQVEFGRKEPGAAESCLAWRQRALAWLADQPPDLLLMTGAGRAYNILGSDGERLPDDEALAEWQRGLAATLAAVPEATRAVVLADTPLMSRNPVSCLAADPSDLSACVTPRSEALAPALDAAERETTQASGATFESLSDLVCPYDPCLVVIGDVLLWRNADHITATFAAQLAPAVRDLVLRGLPTAPAG